MTMTSFFRQKPTLVGCIPGRGVGGWVISTIDDEDDEDRDNDGNNDEDVFDRNV